MRDSVGHTLVAWGIPMRVERSLPVVMVLTLVACALDSGDANRGGSGGTGASGFGGGVSGSGGFGGGVSGNGGFGGGVSGIGGFGGSAGFGGVGGSGGAAGVATGGVGGVDAPTFGECFDVVQMNASGEFLPECWACACEVAERRVDVMACDTNCWAFLRCAAELCGTSDLNCITSNCNSFLGSVGPATPVAPVVQACDPMCFSFPARVDAGI